MKNCLIISAYFPPMGGVGVQRISKLVKYLPSCGWRPMVITIPTWAFRGERDESLLGEIPPEAILKRPFFIDYKKAFPGELGKIFRLLFLSQLQPDRYYWWNYFVIKTVRKLAKEIAIDTVFINVSPFSSLLLVESIKKELTVPVVVNLRDAFSFNNYFLLQQNERARQQAIEIEKKVFPLCDAIVCVTPHLVRQYQALYPQWQDKFHLITNGYDEEDFLGLEAQLPMSERFTIGYNGSISRLVPIEPLLLAISRLLNENKIYIHLTMAGKNSLKEIIGGHRELLEAGLIDHKGFLPHKQSLQNLQKSHVLALMFAKTPATEGAYSGKVFEYLRLGKPILLLHHQDSDLARLIESCNAGRCVDIDDPNQITAALLDWYQQWQNGNLKHQPDWSAIGQFDYRNLTKQLTNLFEMV